MLEGKWKTVIIFQLFAAKQPLRLLDLERRVEGVNQKMLIQQLKELEKNGIVIRTVFPQVPPKVEYKLSPMGLALGPSIESLLDWAFLRRETLEATASPLELSTSGPYYAASGVDCIPWTPEPLQTCSSLPKRLSRHWASMQ